MLKIRRSLLVLMVTLAPFGASAADTSSAMTLNAYRTKAALPAICAQVGGNTTYDGHSAHCQLPTVTTGTAPTENTTTARHVLPVTTRR